MQNHKQRILGRSQTAYIDKIIEKFRMVNVGTVETPIDKCYRLTIMQCPQTNAEIKKDRFCIVC